MADEWAKSLVWANLRGVDSHGVLRIPGYIERLKTNAINPTPNMRVEKRAGAIALLEADRAPGAVAMAMAMAEAMACAREVHVGWCAARNITHAGAVGYFALQAANAGMAGIVMSASSGTDDGLPRRQGRRRLEQSARDRLPGQEPTAAVDRHVHVECRHGESDERTRCRARDSAGLGAGRAGTRHHRSEEARDAAAARWTKGLRPLVHDRMPLQSHGWQPDHRARACP